MLTYFGSGPYCYSSCLAMMLAEHAPQAGVLETLTGSPFGAQVADGTPFFDPGGWHPEIGIDAALTALGWSCTRTAGGSAAEAVDRLRSARLPALAGPIEMGLLSYRLGAGTAIGADHYVVVLEVDGDTVLLHDPQGYPHATLPIEDFVASWRAEEIGYVDAPFVLRTDFLRQHTISPADALEASLPQAIRWLDSAGAGVADIEKLVAAGLAPEIRELLGTFVIRLGARRLSDAATSLASLGHHRAAAAAHAQSRHIGALQHPLATGDDAALRAGLHRLAPGYAHLQATLRDR